ncbi:MAG: bacteriorhodopsin-like [Actinomycetota bacterium]|nr:bacteriorhodopsin-like [Actinomycetota bacterium]MDH5278372.1 bacteriorhodopsin-like [Actinomycetota bacterium]
MVGLPEVSKAQFDIVYNTTSFALVAMLFVGIFLLVSQGRVLPRYRTALVISAVVTGVATYHYFRIFDNFKDAYVSVAPDGAGPYALVNNLAFNEAYRYVDWLLTVPLLLVETVAILSVTQGESRRLLLRLVPASALMIILGYPGEIATDNLTRGVWGALSTIPFLYILYILFVELTKSIDEQPGEARDWVKNLRWLLLASWGFYPIAYMFPMIGFEGTDAFVARQVGYSVADVLAKAVFALMVYRIARIKSFHDDADFARQELSTKDSTSAAPEQHRGS